MTESKEDSIREKMKNCRRQDANAPHVEVPHYERREEGEYGVYIPV
jgi:hypothetical protein